MSTTGVLVSGRHRRRRSAAPLVRFVSVAGDPQSYRNLLYLALALPLGAAYVTVIAVGLAAGVGLAVIVIGLALLLATLFAVRAMAAVERLLSRTLLRIAIHPPIEGGIGLSWRQRVQLWLRDPVTWKSLVYLLAKLPMGIIAATLIGVIGFFSVVLTFAPIIVAFVPVIFFGWEISNPVVALIGMPLGILLFLGGLHLFNGLAWIYGICARIMLGPSTVDLRERVEGLRDASARILAAADDERRRIERDLHDGAQQRLVALAMTLGRAKAAEDPALSRRTGHRGDRLLLRGRGADQRRQARPGLPRVAHRRVPGRPPRGRGARQRRRRRRAQRQRSRGPQGPRACRGW
jgi:signal transduction histidine kinase